MKKKSLLAFLFLAYLGLPFVRAQFQTGIASSNHGGVIGITINPANTNFLSNGTDFSPLYFSSSVLNNDFYLPPKPITGVLKPEIFSAFTQNEALGGETINQKFERLFHLQRSLKPQGYIFVNMAAYGPSFLLNAGRHSFGIQTSFKAGVSTVDLPPLMATFLQKGLASTDLVGKTFNLNMVRAGAIAYTDVAFNYSVKFHESFTKLQRIGITAHYLTGINSVVFEDYGSSWTVFSDTSVLFRNGNFRYNYSANKAKTLDKVLTSKGNGFAFDIGYVFLRKSKIRATRTTYCPNIRGGGKVREYQTYRWKLGISLMDIGYINFNKQTVANLYQNVNSSTKYLDAEFYKGVFALNRAFIEGLRNKYGATYDVTDNFVQYLPTRLNVQFDYHYAENWYFSFFATQRTPLSSHLTVLSPNILSVQARYETMRYEWGFPISLVELQYPIIGLNFRYGPILIGTNHLPEMIGLRNIKGVDLYFGLKFNISNFRGV